MASKLENAATIAVAVAALATATAFVYREVAGLSRGTAMSAFAQPAVFVNNWEQLIERGAASTLEARPITVIEFSDLECPFCRRFHVQLESLLRARESSVRTVFIHYPLRGHRFALPAARAAECAAEQQAFRPFVASVFHKQDSLGLKSWTSFAIEAGIRDTLTFDECAKGHGTPPAVLSGIALGDSLHLMGTPTVIINGWRFSIPPYDSLEVVVDRIVRVGSPNS